MCDYVAENEIQIAVLAIPAKDAQVLIDDLVGSCQPNRPPVVAMTVMPTPSLPGYLMAQSPSVPPARVTETRQGNGQTRLMPPGTVKASTNQLSP